ncbi:hypothetical protein BAY61_18455 [Prauserella marina]|nr:hypothetical protein BAY61_18455 [Prauserella marina]
MFGGVMLARPAQGAVGEAERVCHVIPIPDGTLPNELTALCGTSFGHGQLERLDGPAGMPCESCLWRATVPPNRSLSGGSASFTGETVKRRLDTIERTLSELEIQLDAMRAAIAAILDDRRRDRH